MSAVFLSLCGKILDLLLDLGTLTDSVAQIVELCTANDTLTDNVNLYNVGRVDGEGLLHAAAEADAANREGLGNSAAMLCNDGTLKHLDSLLVALFDAVVHLHGVTDVERGDLGLQLLTYKSRNLFHYSFLLTSNIRAELRRGLF